MAWRILTLLALVAPAPAAGGKGKGMKNLSKLRSAGDIAFSKGDAKKAEQFYSKVIKLEPKNERNYFKRYRAALRQRKYTEGLADLRKAVSLNDKYKAGWEHRANLELMLGECQDAHKSYQRLLDLKPEHAKGKASMATAQQCAQRVAAAAQSSERGDFAAAARHLTATLDLKGATHQLLHTSQALLLLRAHAQMRMAQYFDVLADTGRALKLQQDSMEALLLRGDAYYLLADHDMAMRHYRQALHFDPEDKACKRAYRRLKKITKLAKKGDAAVEQGQHEEALEHFAAARAVDPQHRAFNKDVLLKAAHSHVALKQPQEAKALAAEALQLDPELVAAHVVVGDASMAAEDFEEAVRAYKAAHERAQQDGGVRQKLQKAEAALKQSKQKNYYGILGLKRDATPRQIKSAYRKLAIKWHPDKHGQSEEEQKKASKMFQDIGEANEVLSKPELKEKYDRGEDVFENQGGGGGHGGGPHMFHHGGQHMHFNFGF
eukprot:g7304.t1